MCATVTQKTKIQRLWCAVRRTLFRCSTGRVHGEIDEEQSRPSRVGHRRWKLLKLGEGSWFAIPYRTILEASRDLHRSSRSAFETGSDKGSEMRMKVPLPSYRLDRCAARKSRVCVQSDVWTAALGLYTKTIGFMNGNNGTNKKSHRMLEAHTHTHTHVFT